MKKTVLTFGLLSGAVSVVLMFAMIPFVDRIGFDRAEKLGYTSLVVAFLFVFFGIRSYRENVSGGQISFGKAFTVGLLITLISAVFYVGAWEIASSVFFPDFMEKYANHMVEKVRASGASPEEVARQIEQMNRFKALYANPIGKALMTFLEPLPVGLVMTLISAALLRKRRRAAEVPV